MILTVVDELAMLDIGPLDVVVVRVAASGELMGTLVGVPPGSIELTGVGVVPPGNVSLCFVIMTVLLARRWRGRIVGNVGRDAVMIRLWE